MKQFTQVYTKILCLFALLTIGANSVWALDEYVIVTDFNSSTTFSGNNLNHVNNGTWSNSANRVNFSISGINRYDDERLVYADQAKNTTEYSNFSWAVNDAKYSVSVSGIEAQVRAWSLVSYSATAWFDNNSSVDCGTNSTGKGGAKKVTATTGLSGSRIRLAMRNKSSSWWGGTVAFTLHDIKFTYKVTHKEYLYGFAAVAVSNNNDYGTTTASVANSTIQAAVGVYEASTTATYTASPKEGYQFLGWYENSSMNGEPISTAYTYEKTLTNNTAGSVVTGTLYAKFAEKYDQTIIWNLEPGLEYPTGTLMDATATSGLQVTYSSSNRDYGYINENNRLVVVVPNQTITITASQDGNDHYKPAPDVTKEIITLGANPNQYTDVHASDITYGELLGASILSGKVYLDEVEIAGTLSWVDPMILPVAGTANHMVLFTPDNELAYSSIYFEVPVVVEKATPTITWNISSALRENTIYNNIAVSSNREEALTLTETSDYLSISGLALTIGEIGETEKADITITAHQEESANYKEVTSIQTVTIYPKVVQCVPAIVNSKKVLDNMGAKYVAPSGWCATTETVNGKYEVFGVSWLSFDVQYPQYEGIQLGSWNQGLNSLGTNFWTNLASSLSSMELEGTDKDIELKFTGIPDSLFFETKLQTVSFKLINWTPAKQKNPAWTVYERTIDGTERQVGGSYDAYNTTSIKLPLDSTTRSVRIRIHSAFAGFIQNLRITQKRYIRADKESLVFGTDSKPLQEAQTLTLSYSSLGDCAGTDDKITVTSNNPAFYVDETTITENVGIEQMGSYTIRVRCNDVNQSGKIIFESNDGTQLEVPVSSTKPTISALTAGTAIFQTGTEHAPVAGTNYRAIRTHDFSACFDGAKALYDTLYIYGVTESSAAERLWAYDAHKGYNVPAINVEEGNVHTPCFVYTKNDTQYDYVRTFDAATTTLNIDASDKKLGFVGYKPASLATTIAANQINGANVELYLDNTEMVASGNVFAMSGTATIRANKHNILLATNGAAVKLSDAPSQLTIDDTWQSNEASGLIALRPQAGFPSIDLGSASGKVTINGAQVELHNGSHLAIAHLNGNTEKYDGEVYINDGTIGGEVELGLPKMTRIDGGTFNDGTVLAYTIKGFGKRPRNSRGDMLSRHTMSPEALADKYSWYGHVHLTTDDLAKVHPMLMDEQVCIFEGTVDEDSHNESNWTKWPAADDDVLINAPMIITGAEMKVKSLTINWVRGEHGQPAVTVAPDGGLTVGEGGIDGAVKDNLLLKAGTEGATKGQTGFLRIHPEPNSWELMPQANVELFSIGYYDIESEEENIAAWQYVGVPVETSALAKTFFKKSWIYSWNEKVGDWQNKRVSLVMAPFEGYATTQDKFAEGALISFTGTLLDGKEYKRPLTANGTTIDKGMNVLANSFTAPIDIAQFSTEDFSEGVDPTIYIFNTGSRTDAHQTVDIAEKAEAKGQYLAVPVNNVDAMKAAYKYPTVIAPMQGFCIKTEKEGTVTLNYERLVWNGNYSEHPNTPLRTPKKAVNLSTLGSLCVTISANGWSDNLYMLESESYDKAYEAGYDATKMNSGEFNVFAVEGESRLAVDATDNIIGMYVGVRTGDETTYTLSFSHLMTNNELFLLDKEANEIVDIYDGVEYTFYAEPNTEITDRFQILGREKTPEVTTAIEEAADNDGTKVHKFIKDNQLYILKNGVLYNATGARVY